MEAVRRGEQVVYCMVERDLFILAPRCQPKVSDAHYSIHLRRGVIYAESICNNVSSYVFYSFFFIYSFIQMTSVNVVKVSPMT